jgi:hypothetical protein
LIVTPAKVGVQDIVTQAKAGVQDIVTQAKAGVQDIVAPAKAGVQVAVQCFDATWIPAFAGMTMFVTNACKSP